MQRKPYHRSRQRIAQASAGAATLEEMARRLALRCALLQPGQRHTLTGDGTTWELQVHATGQRWRLDLRTQDFETLP